MNTPDPAEPSQSLVTALIHAQSVEDYLPAYYAFTLSPNPKKYKSTDPVEQWKTLLLCLFSKSELKRCFHKFLFVPEINTNGNIHVHGYYSIDNQIQYYRWFLPACKQWGFTVCKNKIDDKWTYDYVTKDIETMVNIMEDIPVVITKDNLDEVRTNSIVKIPMKPKYTMNIMKYFK